MPVYCWMREVITTCATSPSHRNKDALSRFRSHDIYLSTLEQKKNTQQLSQSTKTGKQHTIGQRIAMEQ